MLSALVLALTAFQQSPFQIVPMSQLPFDRKERLLASGDHDPVGTFLALDNGVSDKAYEAIVHSPECIKIVKLFRRESAGQNAAWSPVGKALPTPTDIDESWLNAFEPGDVGMIVELPYSLPFTNSSDEKPAISLASGTDMRAIGNNRQLCRLGKAPGKFANVRFTARVTQLVASVPKETGSTKTFDDVTYRVVGPISDVKDKLEHIEVVQQGFPSIGTLNVVPGIDWESLAKDSAGAKIQRRSQTQGRAIKPAEALPEGEFHWDVRSNVPVKFWSSINIHRSHPIAGYFGHLPMEPTG